MELERQMATTQKMTALGAMAGGIAHHFNNVIGGVITSIDFAQSSDDSQLVRRLLGSAVAACSAGEPAHAEWLPGVRGG